MAETSLPVTPGSGVNVAGNTDGAGNFLQSVGVEDAVGGAVQNVLAAGTAQSQGNAGLVAGTSWSNTFSITSVTAGTAYDVGNYASVKLQITSQYTGTTPTITFQTSNDNTNWYTTALVSMGSANGEAGSTTTTGMFTGNLTGRYFRLNFTGAYTSGTTAGLIVFSTMPATGRTGVGATQNGTWTVGSNSATGAAVPANAYYIGVKDGSNNLAGLITMNSAADSSAGALATSQHVYVGSNIAERRRQSNIVKTATATASGDTAVWTPTSGKKFRIMQFMITVTANASLASGGLEEIIFRDSSTGMAVGFSLYVPTVAVTTAQGGFTTGWVNLGQGILSASANNVLNVNLGTALATGEARVLVTGIEE